MRRAIATVSLSGTLQAKLEAAAAARFDAVELFEPDFVNFAGDARALRVITDDLGLGIDLYQPFRDFEGMPEALFRRSLDRAERKFDLMQTLGAPLLLVCSNTSPQSLGGAERAAAQLHELVERAARRNLRIGFEALAWGRWVNLYSQAWEIVRRADHPHLGLILDSFHTLSLGDDPTGIAAIPGDKIFFLQMADAPRLAMDVLQWARHHRNFPGQGQLDCEGFFEQTLRAGYTGTLSLEIFNDVFRATPNRRTALDAMRSLLYLESRVRARLEGQGGGRDAHRADEPAPSSEASDEPAPSSGAPDKPQPSSGASDEPAPSSASWLADRDPAARRALESLSLFAPPDAVAFDGFSFLEFAVDGDAGAAALGVWFECFGFAPVGRHRSKAATLYRQGDSQLVVNAEPGSEARARFDEQGTTVCTLGLATVRPMQAADRAAALLSARRDSPRAADELPLPAIVAPGGTLIQFVAREASLADDFTASAAAALPSSARAAPGSDRPAPGLLDIDHIAIGLASDQFDTWVLFARSVLGLAPGESLELADPFGLIRSSGVASPDRKLRLVLNVSLSERTRTARQVSATGRSGGSVHHIALRCDDIFAAMTALRARGARFVPISANYYDDLLARLDIDEALVRRMQSLDVLYDAASSATGIAGRYFHAYSEPFEGRFFFEVVQRDGGYDAYGALNAPARMAAEEQQDGRGADLREQ